MVDSLMLFLKVQRCGPTNPFLHQPCHLSDVSAVIGDSTVVSIDVTGGWHDAGDYIKFFSTAAYTTYMLLFAYEFDEEKFNFDNNGNSVPDILEEARIGLDWLLRCNYAPGKIITQVQDLDDHKLIWRMPEDDSLMFDRPGFYGIGKIKSVSSPL
ncbi:MAG: glycoside hydrolase family 9 protein [Ignavibacteriales bacterium]|nr:glycoside hydrolase family 9 protein [Ignavibacteriales bacterium]